MHVLNSLIYRRQYSTAREIPKIHLHLPNYTALQRRFVVSWMYDVYSNVAVKTSHSQTILFHLNRRSNTSISYSITPHYLHLQSYLSSSELFFLNLTTLTDQKHQQDNKHTNL